jgi:diguanylate cyclase (GGDEF)-like protein
MPGERGTATAAQGNTESRDADLRLQTKILLLLIPLIVVPLLALGWIAYAMLMDNAHERTEEQMKTLLKQIRIHTRSQLQTARANASLFASTGLIQRYLQNRSSSTDSEELGHELSELLFSYQLAYPEYYEIRLLSSDGVELVRSVLGKIENRATDESGNPHFIASSRQPDTIYTAFLRNPDNAEPALLVSKPLFISQSRKTIDAADLKPDAYLQLTVDLGFLADHAHRERVGDNGRIFFTDAEGNILFRKQRSAYPERLAPVLFDYLRGAIDENRRITAEFNGETASIRGTRLDDWVYLFALYPETELLAMRNNLARTVALITCISILVTMAMLFGALKSLLIAPVLKLSHAAGEIGRGKMHTPIDVTSADEIGDLARSFREMGRNLGHYHEKVRYIAYHDSLTGLPNRTMFREYLNRAIAEARRNLNKLSILFLDLDNFKRINDTLGHQAGDKLLTAFADRLSGCLRESDLVSHASPDEATNVVARLAGDEFIILLPHVKGAEDAEKVARRILESLSQKFIIDQQEMYVTSSIGIALHPGDGDNATELMKNADIAMYSAKKLGRNNYQYYSRKLNEAAVQKLEIESRLRCAMENGELELYYQPQLDLATGRISGAESLLRWRDAELGTISPEVFVPIAEEFGLIVPISEWVIQEACHQARRWQEIHKQRISMSINVSAVHFNGQELQEVVVRTLDQTGLEPDAIELELTETGILHDPDLAIATMQAFREMGVKLSLDDFGTGYSSLSYVMNLPIDKLKIDRSFILNMECDKRGAAIVSAIIAMAHSLGLAVIAEGVEKESHVQLLKTMHCDIVQGFHVSRPLTADRFEQLICQQIQRSTA